MFLDSGFQFKVLFETLTALLYERQDYTKPMELKT
jgi:hypothetical protein